MNAPVIADSLIARAEKSGGIEAARRVANDVHQLLRDIPSPSTKAEQPPSVQLITNLRDVPPLSEHLRVTPEQTRNLCPQKTLYVKYSERKSPEGFSEFHTTCFWCMISAIDGRRSAADLSGARYAPLNGVLAARSSAFSKTETVNVVDTILEASGLDWIITTAKLTPQKFMNILSGPIPANYGEMDNEQQELVKMKLARAAQHAWKYDEYGKLLAATQQTNGTMADFIEILLQVDNCPSRMEYGTIARGDEIVERPFVTLLGTMTPASIKKIATSGSELWRDGFFARTVFSCPPVEGKLNHAFERGTIPIPTDLSKALNRFHHRLGIPILDIVADETGKYRKVWVEKPHETLYAISDDAYHRWEAYRTELRDIADRPEWRHDLAASILRLPGMALRVATLAAALEGRGDGKIHLHHWLLGQEQAEMWRTSLHELYAQLNSDMDESYEPSMEDLIISFLSTRPDATVREMQQYGHPRLRKLRSADVHGIIESLMKSNVVGESRREGKARWYKLIK